MTKERLYLFDTTLRDGAQTTGVDFSLEDKRRIAAVLDDLGVDYVEGGFPGANATDTQFLGEPSKLKAAKLTAFGMTKRAGRSVSNDPGLQAVLNSRADAICLVTKSSDYHVRVALGISNEENLAGLEQSVKAVVGTGRECAIDCEHFFDGYKANRAIRARRGAYRLRGRRALGGAVRHQRRHAAARGRAHRRRGGKGRARHAPRHPHAQRHRERRRQHVDGGARRRAPHPGHAQRHRRALRQRQPDVDHPDAAAQERVRRPFRDGRHARAATHADARQPHARRGAEPQPRSPRALRRRERVRDQGRHPRLGHPEGAADVRARRAGERRQPAPPARLQAGRQVEHPRLPSSGSAFRSARTTAA